LLSLCIVLVFRIYSHATGFNATKFGQLKVYSEKTMWIFNNAVKGVIALAFDIFDACPPYRYTEGLLEGKEYLDQEESYVIFVSSNRVQVDEYTFDNLMIGEHVKIRSTRTGRAVNIDRMVPGQGPI